MFDRLYTNHLFVLLHNNADTFEAPKIEKVYKIIEFLIRDNNNDESGGFKSKINIEDDLNKILKKNSESQKTND